MAKTFFFVFLSFFFALFLSCIDKMAAVIPMPAMPLSFQRAYDDQAALSQAGYSFGEFQTDMTVAADRRIIAFSDVHGDIEALLICLRDCAGIIRKKRNADGTERFDPSTSRDPELSALLALDIDDPDYPRDLNYEWNMDGTNATTIVVIIGDIIDPYRPDSITAGDFYYPQVELKMLHFINALNEHSLRMNQGRADFGKIIPLCGNHEIVNFNGNTNWVRNYIFPQDHPSMNNNYWNGMSRFQVFRFGQPGFKLYTQTVGTGVLLKINHSIFVHGELTIKNELDFPHVDWYNKLLNYPLTPAQWQTPEYLRYTQLMLSGLLEGRRYGNPQGNGPVPRRVGDNAKETQFCDTVRNEILHFCNTAAGEHCGPHPDRLIRIIKGHCQQNNFTDPRYSLGTVVQQTAMLDILSNESKVEGVMDETIANRSYGITAECELDAHPIHIGFAYQPQLVKLDIAMGRGQLENEVSYTEKSLRRASERAFFISKIPQVLEIIGEQLQIRRSSVQNMVRHMPRPTYQARVRYMYGRLESLANDILATDLTNTMNRIDLADELQDMVNTPSADPKEKFVKMVLDQWIQLLSALHADIPLIQSKLTQWTTPSIYGGTKKKRSKQSHRTQRKKKTNKTSKRRITRKK